MNTDEFTKLLNLKDKKLYSPVGFGNVVNFDIFNNSISKHIKYTNMLCIIIYGSFLTSYSPSDIDCMIIMNDEEKIDDNVLIKKSKIETYDVVVGWEEPYFDGSGICGGNVYKTCRRGEWNPIPIDISIKSLSIVRENLEKNYKGDIGYTNCFNAIKYGFILACHERFNSDQLFGIKNDNKYTLEKKIFGNRWKIKKVK